MELIIKMPIRAEIVLRRDRRMGRRGSLFGGV
jgi:hypothetical protein